MEEVGMFEAKTKFSEIAKRVQATGRPVRVTNRGEPMVEITPVKPTPTSRRPPAAVFADLARLRTSLAKSSSEQIKADLAEGRS